MSPSSSRSTKPQHSSVHQSEKSSQNLPADTKAQMPLAGENDLLRFQQIIGNRAVSRLLQSKRLSGNLQVLQREEEPHIPLEEAPNLGDTTITPDEEGVRRKISRSTVRIQRFTDDDVNARARQIWEKKGSPPNQSQEDQQKDWFEARRQLETEERAHGIWEEKGKPQNQSQEQSQKDYSDAEFQLNTIRELNVITEAGALVTKLGQIKTRNAGWSVLKYVFKTIADSVRDLLRPSAPARAAAFDLCASAAEKAEMIYYLKGDEAWKNTAMTEAGVDNNTYREALVRLGVFEIGLAGHKTGKEVDKLIETHLNAQVQTNLNARGRITGRVAVLGGADWDIVGREQYGAGWNAKRQTLNAFVDRTTDPPRVFVNKDRGNAGTAIHEGVHMWGSSARPINAESHNLNEGVTEYFARKVCSALTPPIPRTVYANEYDVANHMVGKVGEDPVAKAFFDGNLAGLKAAFASPQHWTNFTTHMENKAWVQAKGVINSM